MNYYIFKVDKKNGAETSTMNKIDSDNDQYIKYNRFLKKDYLTDVEENEDYIPQLVKNEVIIILKEGLFEIKELGTVFEVMFNMLYQHEGDVMVEENCCY